MADLVVVLACVVVVAAGVLTVRRDTSAAQRVARREERLLLSRWLSERASQHEANLAKLGELDARWPEVALREYFKQRVLSFEYKMLAAEVDTAVHLQPPVVLSEGVDQVLALLEEPDADDLADEETASEDEGAPSEGEEPSDGEPSNEGTDMVASLGAYAVLPTELPTAAEFSPEDEVTEVPPRALVLATPRARSL